MTENAGRLLPLRMKISSSIFGSLDQSNPVETVCSSTVSESLGVEGSTKSTVSVFQQAPATSEITIQCPLSSGVKDKMEDKKRRFFRSPSEHFLEVLKQHDKLPQIENQPKSRHSISSELNLTPNISATPVPPPSKNSKILKLQSLSRVKSLSSNSLHSDTESCSKGDKPVQTDCNSSKPTLEKPYLRRVHSLPVIQPVNYLGYKTSGLDSDSPRLYLKTGSFRPQTSGSEASKNVHLCGKENKVCTESTRCAVSHENDEDYEKFSMICHWLAQCEKAHNSNTN